MLLLHIQITMKFISNKSIDTKNTAHIIQIIFNLKYVFFDFAAPKLMLKYIFREKTHTHIPFIITDGWGQLLSLANY